MITESVVDEDLQRCVEITCVDLLPHEVLTLNGLSEFIQVPPQTIERRRSKGHGPRAALMKKELRYIREDVTAWLRYEVKKDERCSRDTYEPRIKTLR